MRIRVSGLKLQNDRPQNGNTAVGPRRNSDVSDDSRSIRIAYDALIVVVVT